VFSELSGRSYLDERSGVVDQAFLLVDLCILEKMKLLAERRPSPFRRRHPTAEEIVEEVYRRVQEQQQQQLEEDLMLRSNFQVVVDRRVRLPAKDSNNNSYGKPNAMPLDSKNLPSASSPSSKSNHGNISTSQPKQRSITPFRRLRRPPPQPETSTSSSSAELIAEFTSLSPQQASTIARVSTAKSTTFLPVEDEEVSIVQWEQNIAGISEVSSFNQSHLDGEECRKKPQRSSWNSCLRARMAVDSDVLSRTNTTIQSFSHTARNIREPPAATNDTAGKSCRRMQDRFQTQKAPSSPKTRKVPLTLASSTQNDRKARSVSPFFGRRRKAAAELISEAEQRAMELSKLSTQPSLALRENRSRSSNRRGDESVESMHRSFTQSKKPRTTRSLSPFSRRKRASELIADIYQTFDTAERSVKANQPIEDAIELILSPPIPKSPYRSRFGKPPIDSTLDSPDAAMPTTKSSDELQTIATVLLKAPLAFSRPQKRNSKLAQSIRGRKSLLVPDPKGSTAITSTGTKATDVSVATSSTEVNAKSTLEKVTKNRSLIRLPSRKGEDQAKGTLVTRQKSFSKAVKASKATRDASDLTPPSSISLGRRSRVSELSTAVPNLGHKGLVEIPLSAKVKTRSLGEHSVAELQSALEKVQQELLGAQETGQKVPRDLVLDHLLAVADTIEATDDRETVRRKLSRLGSVSVAESSTDNRSRNSSIKRRSRHYSDNTSDDSSSTTDDEDTTTDHLDTSGDESSFSNWFGSGKSTRNSSTPNNTGRWAQILDALGLSGLFDTETDIDYDFDLSHSIFEESNDRDLTDDEDVSEKIQDPPAIQKKSFTDFFGKIANIGSSREEMSNVELSNKDDRERQAEKFRQRDDAGEAQRRCEIAEEEQMLRELEDMDFRIRSQQKFDRSIKASGRLKKMANVLRKENETLNLGINENFRVKQSPDREGKIEMYVQDTSAEKQKAAIEEQVLRRAIEAEVVKQSLTESVLKKVHRNQVLQNSPSENTYGPVNVKSKRSSGAKLLGNQKKQHAVAHIPEVPLKSGISTSLKHRRPGSVTTSRSDESRPVTPQPPTMGKKRRSWGRRQSSREPSSKQLSHLSSNEELQRIDSCDDVFDCALSLGSIESHQFSHRVSVDHDIATIPSKEVHATVPKLDPCATRFVPNTRESIDEERSDFAPTRTKRGSFHNKEARRMV
jgi:hypothetical protein